MKRSILALALMACLAGCGPSPEEKVETLVRAKLKDPESAKFSEVRSDSNGLAGCGLVNSKNSFGGYVGDTPFVVVAEQIAFADKDTLVRFPTCCDAVIEASNTQTDSDEVKDFGFCRGIVGRFDWPE